MATVKRERDIVVNCDPTQCQQKTSQSHATQQQFDISVIPINLTCTRCPSPIEWAIQLDNGKDSESVHKPVGRANCLSCNLCIAVNIVRWVPLEEALIIEDDITKCGWIEVLSETDKKIHHVLSQILYREIETPVSDQHEAVFDLPDPKDFMKILWIDGAAAGFYTMKLKGTPVHETMDSYGMHTLDTAYIRSKHRRKGHGIGILTNLVETFPNEDIGFSTPISKPMLRVIKKFLTENTSYRNRFWELSGTGGEGNQKIIWYTFNRSQE